MNQSTVSLAGGSHRDPVCGVRLEESDHSLDYDNETYHFCSAICRERFERDPDLYLERANDQTTTYRQARRDFWLGAAIAVFSNLIGVAALWGYLTLAVGWIPISQFQTTYLIITGLATVGGILLAGWAIDPLLEFFGLFGGTIPENTPREPLRKAAVNFPVYVAMIILFGWFLFGSIGATGAYASGTANYLDWFVHIFLGNLYSGVVVSLAVFYVTEALFAWNILPYLMRKDEVSDLEGVIGVPIWFRIALLVFTTAVFPMVHILVMHYLGDATTGVLMFFIGGIVILALLQGFYILRSISLPIGQIAGEFERFQTGRPLKRNLNIYRADDLGRFSEMFENLVTTIHERDFLQRTFGRYMSQQVLDEILDGQIELGGKRQSATVLFADIRNFTRLTEAMEPEDVVRLLNDYFEHMVQAITKHNGIPDKFLGDGILAVWGVPVDAENHQTDGVKGGLAMLDNLEQFNNKRKTMDRPTLEIGTSVHTGELIAGNIGSREKMEYTVVGDTVNTCSRLESLNKELDSVMTVSGSVYRKLNESLQTKFSQSTRVKPRGKREEIDVYTLKESGRLDTSSPRI